MRPASSLVLAIAVALAATTSGVADAKPKRKAGVAKAKIYKVRIESEPSGAEVYLGDKEAGSAGTTPVELELPAGELVVILELDGYVPRFENVIVEPLTGEAAKITQSHAFSLDPATAMLVVTLEDGQTLPPGTKVSIDGNDVGELPIRTEVEVGAHQIQVVAPGREPYEEWVEVEGGQEHEVTVSGASLGVAVEAPGAPTKRRVVGPVGVLRAGLEFGWRKFRYQEPRTANLRPYDASGTLHLVLDAELHPWRRVIASRVLDRLSITAGVGWSPKITAEDMAGTQIDAYWRSQHAGLRLRALARPALAIDLDAGWSHLLYTFLDRDGFLVDEVPDVDYHMVRIGARVVGRFDALETWLGVENRLVVSAGRLEDRFRGADVDGVAARVGGSYGFLRHHLEARVEGQVTRFGWSFQPESGDMYDADGGSDLLYGVTISVGGRY